MRSLDILGVKPSLFYQSNRKYKTILGSVLSLFFWIFSCIFCIFLILNYFDLNSITLIKNEKSENKNLILNMTNLPIIFGLQYNDRKIISAKNNTSELKLILQSSYIKSCNGDNMKSNLFHEEKIINNFTLKECQLSDLKDYERLFSSENLQNIDKFFCFGVSNMKLELYDFSSSLFSNYSEIKILIVKSEKNTEFRKYTYQKNETRLNEEYLLSMTYIDREIDNINLENPFKLITRYDHFYFGNRLVNIYNINKKSVEYSYDNNLFFNKIEKENFFQQEGIYYKTKKIDEFYENEKIIGKINFTLSKKIDIYYRCRDKLFNIISTIASIINAFYFFFSFVNQHISERLYFMDISEKIMAYEEKTKLNNLSIFKKSNFNDFKKSYMKGGIISNTSSTSLNSGLNIFKRERIMKNSHLKIKITKIINPFNVCNTDKTKKIKRIINIIKGRLSTDFLLQKLNEFEIIKINAIDLKIVKNFNTFSIDELDRITFGNFKEEKEKQWAHSINYKTISSNSKKRLSLRKNFLNENKCISEKKEIIKK